ncbi:MAG: hypothetical protein INH37_05270 [Myxococcaceae bacterium]|nr:hypothetical protein [Myxococcaceae bacterium]
MLVQSTTSGRASAFSAVSTTCRLSPASDVVYRIDVPAGAVATVTAQATWDLVLNAVQVPASNCGSPTQATTCATFADSSSTGLETVRLSNLSNAPSAYFIIIDGYSSPSSGAFSLSAEVFQRPVAPVEIEPNDTRTLADLTGQVLTTGNTINGELGVTEADLFRVNVQTAGVLRLTVNGFGCSGFTGTRLSLLDASANSLSLDEVSTASTCRSLVVQVQPGTYYASFSRTASGTQPLSYWLSASVQSGRIAEVEPNDSTNQAMLITGQDVIVCGALGTTTDFTDTFAFVAPAAFRVQAEVIESMPGVMPSCESQLISSRLELLSGAGLVLASDLTSGRGNCSRLEESPPAGTYFLRVNENVSFGRIGFPYCLVVRVR